MELWGWWRRRARSLATPPEIPPEHSELSRLERIAEQAYSAMYDVPPFHSTKDDYDDACLYFQRAIDEARRLGLSADAARLEQRLDQIRGVYNSQFRGF